MDIKELNPLNLVIHFHIWSKKLIILFQLPLKRVFIKETVRSCNARLFLKELMVQRPLLPKSILQHKESSSFQISLSMVVV